MKASNQVCFFGTSAYLAPIFQSNWKFLAIFNQLSKICMRKLILPFSFLVSFFSDSQDLQYIWSGQIGDSVSNGSVNVQEVIIDEHNNKFISGSFSGIHDFDPGPGVYQMTGLSNNSTSTVYVMKLDSLNHFVWANSYGTSSGSMWHYGLVVDSSGSNYTYGYYEGSLVYDPQNSVNSVSPFWWYSDAYVHKLDPNGQFEWIKSWGANATDGIQMMKLDEDQNFYVVGFYSDSTDVDPGPGTVIVNESAIGHGYYLAKYDSDFNFLWVKPYEGSATVNPSYLTLNASDEITITGRYNGVLDFDLGPGTATENSDYYDLFTQVLDRSGNYKWHHTISGPGIEANGVCVVDSRKNRYISGSFESTMDFNPGGIPNIIEFTPQPANYTDSYIMKLDSLGNQVWTKAIQGLGFSEVQNMKMVSDQLIVLGSVNSKTDLDPNSGLILVEPPLMVNSLLFIEKLDSNATVLWHEEFIGSNTLYLNGFELDRNNNYFGIGNLLGNVDIDPGPNVVQLSQSYNGNNGVATYFVNFGELPCAQLGTSFSSITHASCSTSGGVTASGVYGTPPYSYSWLTNPSSNGSTLITDTCGLYFVKVTDANGCVDTNGVYIDGPVSGSAIDLDVNLVTSTFIQGQPAMISLDAYNSGCQQVTGTVMLVLDPLVQYDSSTVAPTNIIGDTLLWDLVYGNSDSAHFTVTVFATTSQTAITGDTVCFLVQGTPFIGDADTLNNEKIFCEPIFASYDPNDKKVFPRGLCDDHVYMGEDLTYTIRFQNTGNSEAIHVTVVDLMDANLDLSTLQVLSKSHPGLSVNYMGGREVQFNFRNIHLPDSTSDPVGSNGYVIFKISPRAGMAVNSIVSNEVNIYFDFNSPILTNTTSTTFTNDIPCIHTDDLTVFEVEQSIFTVYPNPAMNQLFIESVEAITISIIDMTGKTIQSQVLKPGKNELDVSLLTNGVYVIQSESGVTVKFVKQ